MGSHWIGLCYGRDERWAMVSIIYFFAVQELWLSGIGVQCEMATTTMSIHGRLWMSSITEMGLCGCILQEPAIRGRNRSRGFRRSGLVWSVRIKSILTGSCP